jgi:cytochrome b pre-mRNA-processing protein 3
MRLAPIFGRASVDRAASDLYLALVEQARLPQFYGPGKVPDTLDARFEMIVLHAYLIIHRLRDAGQEGGRVAQALFDQMFADMDRNLREIGVGDLSVGKQIKRMAKRFYGSVDAYDRGLEECGDDALAAALERNVFGSDGAPTEAAKGLCRYLRREVEALVNANDNELFAGRIQFGPPVEI